MAGDRDRRELAWHGNSIAHLHGDGVYQIGRFAFLLDQERTPLGLTHEPGDIGDVEHGVDILVRRGDAGTASLEHGESLH